MPDHGADKPGAGLGEAGIIARYFAPLAKGVPEALGLVDDGALISPGGDNDLIVTTDGLVAGCHFHADAEAGDIAHKALAVNVSDLVAKGAEPFLYFLTLALPSADPLWLEAFSNGLKRAQTSFACRLAGGDTVATPGPLTVSIAAIGKVAKGEMVMRSGGGVGDLVYVTGTIGDGALGLMLLEKRAGIEWTLDEQGAAHLKARYRRPTPSIAAAAILRRHASAAMDVSDGLAGDFAVLCNASGVGGEIYTARLPLSPAARKALTNEPALLEAIATGGDDYEILAAVAAEDQTSFETEARAAGVQVTQIGVLRPADEGVALRDEAGRLISFACERFDHFLEDRNS